MIQVVEQSTDTNLIVRFDVDLDLTGNSLAAVEDLASWSVTPDGAGVGVDVLGVEVVSDSEIWLTIGLATSGEDYTLEILGAIFSTAPAPLVGEQKTYTANVYAPEVASIEILSSRLVLVTFGREIFRNTDLLDTANYVFTAVEPGAAPGLETLRVSRITPTTVLVTTSTQDPAVLYDLTVNP